ncbi:hypothetical protein [Bifidobacterium mongoliense]|uniref:hypothetical protein n=1 Tax=Bifidobacterium mongoliense TaxID=518643 RepID=UPI0030ED801F
MTKYCISEGQINVNHAGPKARTDITTILTRDGWKTLNVHRRLDDELLTKEQWQKQSHHINKRFLRRLLSVPLNISDWISIERQTVAGDVILIQFPLAMYPQVSRTALPLIERIKQHGRKIIFLIHDLESLRGYDGENLEKEFLSLADVLIAHNNKMKEYLLACKYCRKVVVLNIFDYLFSSEVEYSSRKYTPNEIDVAGNLFKEKSAYIYKLCNAFPGATFNLYGPNFDAESPEAKWYRGNFKPEKLISELHGEFGLVWDGNSLETCSGDFGQYLKYNNPHKMSLYLALGEPVIVWNKSAQAEFVEDERIGLVVSSVKEGLDMVKNCSELEKKTMQSNAEKIGEKIRSGSFTRTALNKAQEMIDRL